MDKISINSIINVNKGTKSFTPNNSKGRFIVKNKEILNDNKNKKALNSKPSRIQYKKTIQKVLVDFFL